MSLDPHEAQYSVRDVLAAIPGLPPLTLRNWLVHGHIKPALPDNRRGGVHLFNAFDVVAIAALWHVTNATGIPPGVLRPALGQVAQQAERVWQDSWRRKAPGSDFVIRPEEYDLWIRFVLYLNENGYLVCREFDDPHSGRFTALPRAYTVLEVDALAAGVFNRLLRMLAAK
jgi:hypothetical protein